MHPAAVNLNMQAQANKKVFLTARWQYLAMANYEVPPGLLAPYVPLGTELDLYEGKALVSLVGFLFKDTRVFGLKWPWHTHFEEVNLRLYIKRTLPDGTVRRGVAFVSEIVPRPAIAFIANRLYNEHYRYMPMGHSISRQNGNINLSYTWWLKNTANSLTLSATDEPRPIENGSAAHFIFEHYWGYNQLNSQTTVEYGVEHPRWLVYEVNEMQVDCHIAQVYGAEWVPYLNVPPHSTMLAYGSEVVVRKPVLLKFPLK